MVSGVPLLPIWMACRPQRRRSGSLPSVLARRPSTKIRCPAARGGSSTVPMLASAPSPRPLSLIASDAFGGPVAGPTRPRLPDQRAEPRRRRARAGGRARRERRAGGDRRATAKIPIAAVARSAAPGRSRRPTAARRRRRRRVRRDGLRARHAHHGRNRCRDRRRFRWRLGARRSFRGGLRRAAVPRRARMRTCWPASDVGSSLSAS